MFFFADRSKRSDRLLEWKVRIFSVGAVLTVIGIYLEERWVTGTAVVVLAGGMLLKFGPGGGRTAEDSEADPDADD